ncbi:MAG: TRAP transporter small permease [Pseudomonadota bacterium]
MASHPVNEDGSAVSLADRALFRVESAFNLVGGLTALLVVLISVVNIFGRKLFNFPVPGYIDWMQQMVPIMAIIGIGYVQRLGGHIRMDIVVNMLKGRALYLFELVSIVLMMAITSLLCYGAYLHAERAIVNGDSTVDIYLPTWPVKLLIPIMFALLMIRFALQLWAYTMAFIENPKRPVAIPMPEDAAHQAQREADTVSGAGAI